MNQKLRVIYASPEVAPFAKSGEIADVASALPKFLSSLGVEISLIMPKYRRPEIESMTTEMVLPELLVPLGGEKIKASIYKSEMGKYDVFFVDNPKYFWREKIYGPSKGEYLDNDERFIFFSRAVLEFLRVSGRAVDIIHCNNWPTALIPVFLKTHYAQEPQFKHVATVLTLHNIAYQGVYPPESLALTELNWNYFTPSQLSFNGRFNFLKAGILFSDVINTVSSAYKREIQTNRHGFGLDKILESKKNFFFSVHNGIDYEVWNPETDRYIAANYSRANLTGKKACKADLIKEFKLPLKTTTPLLGIVSYLTYHKGFDLLIDTIDEIAEMDVGLIVLGPGDEKYESRFSELQKRYPEKVAAKFEMSPVCAHKVIAGADIFLMPSLHEPCGLNQLYSFRYGTVPVVRATGGLKVTVKPFNPRSLKGNGFVFKKYSSQAFLDALKMALEYYSKPDVWQKIMRAGLEEDFSWEIATRRYLRIYRKALELKKKSPN